MDTNLRADIIKRLQCIEGHARGVCRMVETEQDCTAIIHQLKAMQGALSKVRRLLIEQYLASELTPALDSKDGGDREMLIGHFAKLLVERGLE